MVEKVKSHYGERIDIKQFDTQEMPYPDASLDVVIIFEALYYVPSTDKFVEECKRILRPGGFVLVSNANKDLFDFNPSPYSSVYHGVKELTVLFDTAGFKTKFWGSTPVATIGVRQKIVRPLKSIAVNSGLMPKSMAGKRLLKRLVFGNPVEMPAEIGDHTAPVETPIELQAGLSNDQFKVIYCAAQKSKIQLADRETFNMNEIPFFNYPALYKRFEADFDRIFKDVCSRGAFILQKDLEEFEGKLARYLNVKHALGVADGTNAMFIGLQSAGIKPGDEIIIASHTYIATAAAIKMVGAEPVFADIGDDYMMSAASAATKITSKTRAIMPTQLNGRCCNMDDIQALADEHDLLVFEDSAQGLGAKFKGKSAGTFGTFGTLSFYPAKVMGCFGDGGAVMTNDAVMAEKLGLWRDHGRDAEGEVVAWGTNSRLDNLQAAFLNFLIDQYGVDVARRREIAGKYHEAFKDHKMIHPPQGPSNGDHFDIYQNYELAAENRDKLREHLLANGIRNIIQWAGTPVHHFESLGYGQGKFTDLPKTDWFFERCLMLPMNMSITDAEVDRVIETVLSFYE